MPELYVPVLRPSNRLVVLSHLMRRLFILSALLSAACGGSSPTAPGPKPQPSTVTISGRVTTTLSGEPVAATLNVSGRIITANASGQWSLDGQNTNATLPVEVSADGYLTRQTTVKTQNGRTDVAIDLIRDGGEFSLDFYRQMVRNGFAAPDSVGSEPLRRWTVNPSIHLQSLPAGADLGAIETVITSIVSQATGGTLSVASVTSGSTPSAATSTINVAFVNDAGMTQCGLAQVGSTSVTINTARCVCGGSVVNPEVLAHEIGHSLGFRHTAIGLMRGTGSGCSTTALSPAEQYHARIAYSRQPGNMDVDRDGSGFALLHGPTQSAPIVQCYR